MNWVLKYRTVRIPCSAVNPAIEPPSLPAPCASEGSAAEASAAEGTVAQRSPAEPPAPRPGALARRSAPREPVLSEAERARRPHPARHARICSICNHPDRDAIEEDFTHWHSPSDIAFDYHLPDRSSVYRHAHATGLFARRSRNLRFVLENLLERVDKVKVTAHAVIRAVRAYTRINDAGEWIEPPTRIIVSSGSPPAARSPVYTERSERALPASTQHAQRVALPACTEPSERARTRPSERIPGKARAKPHSNRHRRPQSR